MVVVVSFSHGLHPSLDSGTWETQVRSLKISTVREIIHLLRLSKGPYLSIIYFEGSLLSSSC